MSATKDKKQGYLFSSNTTPSISSPLAGTVMNTSEEKQSGQHGPILKPRSLRPASEQQDQPTNSLFSSTFFGSSNCSAEFSMRSPPPTSTSVFSTAPPTSQRMPDPRLPATRDIDTAGSVIKVEVGHPHSTLYVHRAALLKSSELLKDKAKSEWSTVDSEPTVNLPDHASEAFVIYSKWLYGGGIASIPREGDDAPKPDESEWLNLANAYALGEALIDVDFKDTVIDALRAKIRSSSGSSIWPVAPRLVRIIYNGTPAAASARRFMVDVYQAHADAKDLDSNQDGSFPSDFLLDLAKASLSRRVKTPITSLGLITITRCNYHEHGAEKPCYIDRKP